MGNCYISRRSTALSSSSGIDETYLPKSTSSNIILSTAAPYEHNVFFIKNQFYTNLSAENTDVTCYCVVKCSTSSSDVALMCVQYANTNGNAPTFYSDSSSYQVYATIYSGNQALPNIFCDVYHVYTMSINNTTKKVRYFVDGVYFLEKTFNNSGSSVIIGAGDKNGYSFSNRRLDVLYFGVVSECETDETVIANMRTIMSKLNLD